MSNVELAIVVIVLAAGAGIFAWATRRAARHGEVLGSGSGFLCDKCKYNDVRYCSRPERPNAYECKEFKAR